MPRRHRTTARSLIALLALWVSSGTASAAVPRLDFPVVGVSQHIDDFGDPRGDRRHQGNDIMAKRKTPVVAVESGRVYKPTWSTSDCILILEGNSGTHYWYLHLNNDLTMSNDNDGGCRNGVSFAADMPRSKGVKKDVRVGRMIGYVGNSGNADATSPHLHFELHPNGGSAVDPFKRLKEARRLLFTVPGSVTELRLHLGGRFYSAVDGVLKLDVSRTYVQKKWRAVPTRRVSLAYGDDLVVQRRDSSGDVTPATLASAKQGERAVVKTGIISGRSMIRAAQLRRAGIIVAKRLQLRG